MSCPTSGSYTSGYCTGCTNLELSIGTISECGVCCNKSVLSKINSDYIHNGKVTIVDFNKKKVQTNLKYKITNGFLEYDYNYKKTHESLLGDSTKLTIVKEGISTLTNLKNNIMLFKVNLHSLFNINIFTSIVSTKLYSDGIKNFINIIKSIDNKLNFSGPTSYNYFINDYYLDYFVNKNEFALICCKFSAKIIFIWQIIFEIANGYNLIIDFDFYLTFYNFIYDNIAIFMKIDHQIVNKFFNKYVENFMSDYFNDIITYFFNAIDNESKLEMIIFYKYSSNLLTFEELKYFKTDILIERLNPQNIYINILKQISYINKKHTIQPIGTEEYVNLLIKNSNYFELFQ